VEHDTHFEEKKVGIVFQSTNLSFIPVDIQQGPDGAMYIADWYNPVKGHAQYSLRDTRRDKKSGRIWRITAKGQPLEEAPKIAGASIPELLDLLKSENYRTRYRAKVELREKLSRNDSSKDELITLNRWLMIQSIGGWESGQESDPQTLLEALWLSKWVEEFRLTSNSVKGRGYEIGTYDGWLSNEVMKSSKAKLRASATRSLRWSDEDLGMPVSALNKDGKQVDVPHVTRTALHKRAANDPSGLVRLEAAIAASYIGTPEALEAALDLLKHPMDPYLTYALRTSLDSHTLQPLWKGNTAFLAKHPELEKFLKDSEPTKPALMAKKKKPEPPNPFDAQPGLQTITIKTIPERLLYDLREFKVAPGAPVKLVFENPDVTPHNLLIVQPGAADEVGLAGNEMAKTPDGFAKGFIPDSPKILHKTQMLNQGDREVLRFTAPTAKGKYPYICTFPGHWLVMKGEMVVE
jgi:plastocyanin